MKKTTKKSLTRSQCVAAVFAVLLVGLALITLSMAATSHMCVLTHDTRAVFHCRQIILSIRLYASDEGGVYPDSKVPEAIDSNTAFRQLFISGAIEDEKPFGCPVGPFQADGNIGSPPDYAFAVEAGENHWAMTKGIDDQSPGGIPAVYENPAEPAWPPTWNADAADMNVKGRTWKGGKIVVGLNDTSVELMKLSSKYGSKVSFPKERDPFANAPANPHARKYEVLDVAVRKP